MTTVTVELDVYEQITTHVWWPHSRPPDRSFSCTEVTLHYIAFTSAIVSKRSPDHMTTYFELKDEKWLEVKINITLVRPKKNKSAKLTQNTTIMFVVNSMVMTTFLGPGYSTWTAYATNSVFGQFKGHNSGVPGGIWQVIELGRDIMPTNIL